MTHPNKSTQSPVQEVQAIDAVNGAKSVINTLSSMINEYFSSPCFYELSPIEKVIETRNVGALVNAISPQTLTDERFETLLFELHQTLKGESK